MDFQQAANIPHDSASPETFPVWMITELDLESGSLYSFHNFTLQVQDDKQIVKVTRCI